jgi:hypothetical protein
MWLDLERLNPIRLKLTLGHHLESLAINITICLCQSLLVFGLRFDSWLHEAINFLRHYESASPLERAPINLAFAFGFSLNLIMVVMARKLNKGAGQ